MENEPSTSASNPETPNIFPGNVSDTEFSKSHGLKKSLHGIAYQLNILMWFLHQGRDDDSIVEFGLATEMEEAEKFDDVVFKSIKNRKEGEINTDEFRLLQAKHKQDKDQNISYNDLITKNPKDDFSLLNYFKSYRDIKKNKNKSNPFFIKDKLMVKDFIIWTNIGFDLKKLKESRIDLKEIPKDKYLSMGNIYQFEFKGHTDLELLAKELINHILNKKEMNWKKTPIFESYHVALVKEKVIGKNGKNGKFHANLFKSKNAAIKKLLELLKPLQDMNQSGDLQEFKLDKEEFKLSDDFDKNSPGQKSLKDCMATKYDHEIYEILKQASDMHVLAQEIADHVKKNKKFTLRSRIFKSYHITLMKELQVIEKIEKPKKPKKNEDLTKTKNTEKNGRFHKDFIEFYNKNNDENIQTGKAGDIKKNFWIILKDKMKKKNISELNEEPKLSLSEKFGIGSTLKRDLQETEVADLAEKLVTKIKQTEPGEQVKVSRGKKVKDSIDSLAKHVIDLTEDGKKLQFSQAFLNNDNLPGNLEKFKTKFYEMLKDEKIPKDKKKVKNIIIDQDTLGQFEFHITDFTWGKELTNDDIKNSEIDEFFNKLVFAVDQPDVDELNEEIKSEIGKEFNLIDCDLFTDHIQKKILNWFKNKREKNGDKGFMSKKEANEMYNIAKNKCSKLKLFSFKLNHQAENGTFNFSIPNDENDKGICKLEIKKESTGAAVSKEITETNSSISIPINPLLNLQVCKPENNDLLIIEGENECENKTKIGGEMEKIQNELSEIIEGKNKGKIVSNPDQANNLNKKKKTQKKEKF